MKYQKPEIVVFDQASKAIQSTGKNGGGTESDHEPSLTAYEADE